MFYTGALCLLPGTAPSRSGLGTEPVLPSRDREGAVHGTEPLKCASILVADMVLCGAGAFACHDTPATMQQQYVAKDRKQNKAHHAASVTGRAKENRPACWQTTRRRLPSVDLNNNAALLDR